MTQKENLIERMDTVKAESVSDKEFEDAWGISLDAQVEKMMAKWDSMLAQAKDAIDSQEQPDGERHPLAADLEEDSAEEAEKEGREAPVRTMGRVIFLSFNEFKKLEKADFDKKENFKTRKKVRHETLKKVMLHLSKFLSEAMEKECPPQKSDTEKERMEQLAVWQIRYRLRKGLGKRPSRQLTREELAERIEASGVDYARIGIAMMDFDFMDREEEKEELLRRLNQAMPEGVHLQPCKEEEIGLDVPIIEVECVPKLCKRTKPKRLH